MWWFHVGTIEELCAHRQGLLIEGRGMPFIYRDHTIIAGAAPSTTETNFIPVVYISWELTSSEKGTHALFSGNRYPTHREASDAAMAEAKAWVDGHLKHLAEIVLLGRKS